MAEPLRVLHLGKYFTPFSGGIEQFMRDLMLAQQRAGLDVSAVVHDHESGRPTGEETIDGMSVVRVRSHGAALYAPIAPTFGSELRKAVDRFKPDVIHVHMPNLSAFWGLFSGAVKRVPWVTHWHSDVVFSKHDRRLAMAYRVYRPFETKVLRRSRAIIATSPPYLDSSVALKPHRDRCRVVPLGIDSARLPEPDAQAVTWAESQWPADTLRVLTLGRLTYYKGHRFLVDAVAQTPGVSACFVGRGDRDAALREQIANCNVGDRVSLAGFVEDDRVRGLLATCDLFCLPSIERTEAFGVVLMEAMRYGKPLLACRIEGSGVTWVVRDGDNGLLVPTADSSALADALASLRDDPALRERFGESGRKRYAEDFDIDRVADAVTGVYRSCLT